MLLQVLFSVNLEAQNTKFEYLTPDEGLSQSSVQCIFQDKFGFMWFGTQSGLNKYDGYKFTKYYHSTKDSTSIGGDFINCIYEDSHGDLWIGTDGGLSLYDRNLDIFMTYRHLDNNLNSLSDSRVFCLYEDNHGQFWIGTTGGGLDLLNRKENKFIHFKHNENDPNSISNDAIHAIVGDSEGNIWVGTENGGLNLSKPPVKYYSLIFFMMIMILPVYPIIISLRSQKINWDLFGLEHWAEAYAG